MTARAATGAFLAILAAAVLFRAFLVAAVPFGQKVAFRLEGLNDEPAHLHYVAYLAEHRALPVQARHSREPSAFERGDYEYYQPPLYYLIGAPLYAAAGGKPVGLYACRLLSFTCGLLSLVVMGRILRRLGCTDACRRAGVLFLALLPTHAYFSALVSNDALSWLIALRLTDHVLGLLDTARTDVEPIRTRALVGSGLLLAAGLLTKTSLAIFVPALLLAHAHVAWRRSEELSILRSLLPLLIAGLLAGPWYGRNVLLYGSVTALEVGFGPPEPGRASLAGIAHTLKATVRYLWLPMQHVPAGGPVLWLRWVGAGLLAVHAVLAAEFLRRRGAGDLKPFMALFILIAAVAAQLTLGLSWGNIEGRFLLPALASIVFLMVAPVFAVAARRPRGDTAATIYLALVAAHPYLFLAFA